MDPVIPKFESCLQLPGSCLQLAGISMLPMMSMALVVALVAAVTLMVAKVDKGERVGEWKGPLIGVRWRVSVR